MQPQAYTKFALNSPHSPMLRNVFFVLVLATLAATTAAAIDVRPVRMHRHSSPTLHEHRGFRTVAHRSSHRTSEPPRARSMHAVARHPSIRPSEPTRERAVSLRSLRRERGSARYAELRPDRRLHRREFRRSAPAVRFYRRPHLEAASLHSRPILMASPLRGSLESLEHQNEMANEEGLERILDEQDLSNRIAERLLVPVPVSDALTVNQDLPENHRYCRPWTAVFLRDLARDHNARFHRPLEVSSAVRTVEYQKHLMRINGNAAAAEGDIVSPHLTGATIDIAKHGMTRDELAWMRSWLLQLQVAGQIDVEEEFRQACFHITVYKSYAPSADGDPLRKADQQAPAGMPNTTGGE